MTATDPPSAAEPVLAHLHRAPAARERGAHDVLVVGGGHAGIEAVLAAARLGARAALITFRADKIGEMSCNPAIGGQGKGQLVRELDALGGAMACATDATGIQFRMLNTAKGLAVQAPRAQCDRHLYRDEVTRVVRATSGVEVIEGAVEGFLVSTAVDPDGPRVRGVRLADGRELTASAVVLTTGTFLSAVMHTGESRAAGGRMGESTSHGLSRDLHALGLPVGRLKTGTPPRFAADSIDWGKLKPQPGDAPPLPFSFATERARFPVQRQVDCFLTYTNPAAHALIRANIHRAPMYAGRIQGVGPRYCPSVEDKVMRFAERERHQIFLEPEGLTTDVIYANGISTSLPGEIQERFVHAIEGLERVRFLRHGYAVEYDFVQPSALDRTLAARAVRGLYLAGQINGTSGYEEAGAQGLIAGANAALWALGREPFVLARHEAYIGVLVDDLVVSQPREPYRMFSSRAEYRLLLRQDDADRRLSARGAAVGLVGAAQLERAHARQREVEALTRVLETLRAPRQPGHALAAYLRRPEVRLSELVAATPELAALAPDPSVVTTVEADVKYAGYVERQRASVERLARDEATAIPPELDLAGISGLRGEAREKLAALKPATLGAAGRIAGVNPPDLALLAVHVERHRRQRAQRGGG
ncbi:MAG: tRNA uridine-5-carboxymethylaminomethyl(34) synthesis enzyme MnmG [Planctomycetes bacterium]|nr:tRNA uridine-5-carboxymethylaminomethyl(34) synthesis enzyme MnmG [Planctomycetota bacterium]